MLREDLGVSLKDEQIDAHSPLSAIDHPIVRKSAESFGTNPADDIHEGPIRGSRRVQLLEVRQSQWRGGVWVDGATGQPWLVAAGLAKGNHQDHDDFYERVKRADESGTTETWLPTDRDRRQLRREEAAALMVRWELGLQAAILTALEKVLGGGETTVTITHPKGGEPEIGTAIVTVEPSLDTDYAHDDVLLEIDLSNIHKGSMLGWTATLRLLTTINPIQAAWDRSGNLYSPVPDAGRTSERVKELRALVGADELAVSVPNDLAHYSHRRNLAQPSVEGNGVRSLCGIYFVPTRDHATLPRCAICEERYQALP